MICHKCGCVICLNEMPKIITDEKGQITCPICIAKEEDRKRQDETYKDYKIKHGTH